VTAGKPVADVVVFGCRSAGWDRSRALRSAGVELVPVSCAGSLHSSVVEAALRKGAAGVMVISCPVRDCRFREGPKWTEQRLFHGREAELRERVDRRRIAYAALGPGEGGLALARLAELRARIAALQRPAADEPPAEPECEATLAREEAHA
jgi:coenzyme F420-reducing hydrogenase delta subunit